MANLKFQTQHNQKGQILSASSPYVKNLLSRKKFKVEESLTEALLKALSTKIFYTLAHYKLFDQLVGTIQLGEGLAEITPYRSVLGDVRFIVKLKPAENEEIVVYWDGKMSLKSKTNSSGVTVDRPNLDFSQNLDFFVQFEQKVVEQLHAIEDQFFEAIPVEVGNRAQAEEATA